MGYTTWFTGDIQIKPALKPEHELYLDQFFDKRHVALDTEKLEPFPDAVREAAELPLGHQGMFFIGDDGLPTEAELDSPNDQLPGYWCNWSVMTLADKDESILQWNEGENFYEYEAWLAFVLNTFLVPWGYTLNGVIEWEGEESEDYGLLEIAENVLTIYDGVKIYAPRKKVA